MAPRTAPTVLGALLLLAFIYLSFFSPARSPFPLRLPIPSLQPPMSFAARNATHFIDLADNSTLYINGWNSYWLMSSASPPLISSMLRQARAMGLTVCRTWAFSDRLHTHPARFDPRLFQSLDYVVYEARRSGVRLILSLANSLSAFGGKERYVRWAMAAGANVTVESDAFFEDETVKGYYKDYVKAILTRRNSFSGIRYMDEPAILAWELMNEPRCVFNSSAPLLQAWIVEMASYVKSLDNKHLVTVGLEGFYGAGRPERLGVNPGDWASSVGSDFIQNSADEHIDFASVHAYPDTWLPKANLEEKVKFLSSWVESHVNDSEYILKKPVIFSEVGFNLHVEEHGVFERDIALKMVYDKIYESAKRRQAGAGALIWQLMIEKMEGYHDEFSLVAGEYPSTYKLIEQQSCRLRKLFMRKGEENQKISQLC